MLRAEGVHVDHVQRGGERVGIYFAETGASQRASTVVYDRAHSAISEMAPGTHAVACVLAGAGVVPLHRHHPGARRRRRRPARAKRSRPPRPAGVPVSIDLNFRSKLWTPAEAQRVMRPLVQCVDVVIANEEDLQAVLGITVEHADVTGGVLDVGGYRAAAARVAAEFGVKRVSR